MAEDWAVGIHAVAAAVDAGEVEQLWIARERAKDRRVQDVIAAAERQGTVLRWSAAADLGRLGVGSQHQGLVARLLAKPAPQLGEVLADIPHPGLLLILDGILDPHNLGACLRSAEAAGVHAVLLPKDRACPINATVRKAAAGAASRLPIVHVTNLVRSMVDLKDRGYWIAGLAGEAGQDLYAADLRGPLAVVLGSEEKGLRRLVRESCDFLWRIPMSGAMESLNVSVAGAVALFEARRQRQAQAGQAERIALE